MGPMVKRGINNTFGPYCVIDGDVTIGSHNKFQSHVSVGSPAEHRSIQGNGGVIIGDRNEFREFVTINSGLTPSSPTIIGNGCYLMTKCHIGHDAIIEDDVTLSCLSIVGGHSCVMRGANIGLGAVIHQKRVVGTLAMVGMNSTVSRHVLPCVVAFGSPAKALRINRVGLTRQNWDPDLIEAWDVYLSNLQSHSDMNHEKMNLVDEQIERWSNRVKAVED